ncbi:hypothetical protein K1719_004658 [Acacia pycnantha]|nr:hypothetical protein K1719_004658 [Acacia pycnantha]
MMAAPICILSFQNLYVRLIAYCVNFLPPSSCLCSLNWLLDRRWQGFLGIFMGFPDLIFLNTNYNKLRVQKAAFQKSMVYGICDKDTAWPYQKEREASEELYFGLKTRQGLLEFKCNSKLHKQQWVEGIESLVRQLNSLEATESSLETLSISNTI